MKCFTCIICGKNKLYTEFGPYKNPKKCLLCQKKSKSEYDKKRYDPFNDKKYREENSEIIKERKQIYYLENKDEIDERNKEYNKIHREEIREYQKNYTKQRRSTDPIFNLKGRVSNMINLYLKKNGGNKNKISILKFLPYTIQELRFHLEYQFEPWMTWNNYGKYDTKVWNENDQSTWKWNIDHIIPQKKLPYSSMKDDNFQKCWALTNLRPYSAKQNLIDGSR